VQHFGDDVEVAFKRNGDHSCRRHGSDAITGRCTGLQSTKPGPYFMRVHGEPRSEHERTFFLFSNTLLSVCLLLQYLFKVRNTNFRSKMNLFASAV